MALILDGDTGVSTLQNHEKITVNSAGEVSAKRLVDISTVGGSRLYNDTTQTYTYISSISPDGSATANHYHNCNEFRIQSNGIDRVIMDSSGRVNMPYQPHVYLRANGHIYATTANTWEQITTAGTFSVESSVGSEWDNTTNRYTVQKAGTYRITVNHLSKDQAHSRVLINGVDNGQSHSRQGETGYCATSGINFLKYLNAGDYIEFGKYISSVGYIYNHPYSHFTIKLES